MAGSRSEKRFLSRFKVVGFYASSSVIDVVLRDLSAEGMSIETRRPMRVGASYPFKIREGTQVVEVVGVVKWCKLRRMIDIGGGESQAIYRAGVAFGDPLDGFVPRFGSPETEPGPESPSPTASPAVRRQPRKLRSLNCPDCRVPVVLGARRCRICGAILPQA